LLGNSAVGSQRDYVLAGRSRAFRFRAIAPGFVAEAHIYVDRGSTASSLTIGLYSNAGGRPGTLLSTGVTDFLVPGAWNPVRMGQVELRAGMVYWLAVLGEGGVLRYREAQPGQCSSQASSQSALSALPPSWDQGKIERGCSVSAYVTPPPKAPSAEFIAQPIVPPLPAAVVPAETAPPPASQPAPLAPPESVALPEISGTPLEGEVLTSSEGEWTENPTSYAYQWQACEANGETCTDVEGANEGSYTLGSADVGHTLRVLVTAANVGGSASASSPPTGVVEEPLSPPPANTALPKISGEAIEGETLSASEGEWAGNPTSYAYQWQHCDAAGGGCTDVGGATGSTYDLLAGDVGGTLRVVVTATNAGGSESAGSEPTEVVEASPPSPPAAAPVDLVLPVISGEVSKGEVLSASAGEWSGDPASYAYQWQRCSKAGVSCSNVSGATHGTYSLSSSDVGLTLRVVVKATNADGVGSADSAVTGVVAEPPPPAPSNTALPTISGTVIQGHVLSASQGSWTGSPTSYGYQWQRCGVTGGGCSSVSGATHNTYSLGSGDVGHTLRVVVSATNRGGTASAISAASIPVTAPLPPAPTNSSLPVITGTTVEGDLLSAAHGTWTGSPTSYAYQWQRCGTTGAGCSNVSGTTGTSYLLAASDVGHTLRVVVTASNGGGKASATSAQTATVVAHSAQQTDCFSAPGACGYPDPKAANVGPSAACSSLAPSGGLTISTAGTTIKNMNITGQVTVSADNVTLTNDCISTDGDGSLGSKAVSIDGGATGTQITHSDVSGASSTSESVEEALSNNGGSEDTTADHDYIFNCGECVHGTWKLTNSYVTSNATISTDHYEDIYCNDMTFVAEHDVLLNPHEQTANLFCDTNDGSGGAADDHITLTNSLLAGSGYSVYPQGNSSSVGSSTMNISDNRFARCLTSQVYNSESGGTDCSGGADSFGYYPFGGQYGVDAYVYCPPTSGQVWSGNVWDNNDETIGC
jgi:hypothetical protein